MLSALRRSFFSHARMSAPLLKGMKPPAIRPGAFFVLTASLLSAALPAAAPAAPAANRLSQGMPSAHTGHHPAAATGDDAHNTAKHKPGAQGNAARVTSHSAPPGPADKTGLHAASPQESHHPSLQEKLEQAEQDLAGELDDQKAQSLTKKAETLRLFTVQNGGRLLLTAAQDALKKGHTDEAEKDLSAAITLQPDNPFLRRQRAAIRLMGNDLTGAVEDLQQALVKDPGDAQSWDLLARTQEHLHHPGQALHAYTEALTYAPLLPGGQTRYQQLEQKAHGRPD